MTKEELDAQTARQREAAKKTLAAQEEHDQRHQDAHVDSMLTTDAHVGKASSEPHKPQEMEDRKVDKARITGDPHVVTKPLQTRGETTDEVTTEPVGARPGGPGGPAPLSMPHRAAAAAAGDATGGERDKEEKAKDAKAKEKQRGRR